MSTNLMLEYAGSTEVNVPDGSVSSIEIDLPDRNISKTISVGVSVRPLNLAVSIVDGKIHHSFSDKPFAYL